MVEIIEKVQDIETMPNWAKEAFEKGNFFHVALKRIEVLEKVNSQLYNPKAKSKESKSNESPPIVLVEGCHVNDGGYKADNKEWKISTLLKAVKDQKCEEFDLPLSSINLASLYFRVSDMDDFIYQMRRVIDTNLKYPIILDWVGRICDGWHRVCKAIVLKKSTIKAVRLKKYVQADYIHDDK